MSKLAHMLQGDKLAILYNVITFDFMCENSKIIVASPEIIATFQQKV